MPPPRISQGLLAQFSQMSLSASRPTLLQQTCLSKCRFTVPTTKPSVRLFSSTPSNLSYLAPKGGESRKSRKGRCRVPTGGSMRGTTVVWGDYGLRMRDHDRRISAHQLRIAEETIRKRLRGMKFRLYMRIAANIGVYTSGNDVRMGKGKGSFDRWTARVAVSKIIFEIQGDLHEQVVKDAFRLAGNKLPGLYEFVKKGDPPVMGLTKVGVNGITEEDLKRPRRKEPLEQTAARLPSA
ncbi:RplP Ribosomal protein L16 L10E [Pyrenophora tritici-repentis]|uniref:50S ribosomal protein L16 n=2 Tax=Pyrenophora tritici-repentis TaxID=45151 RepID=A0A2W1EGY2_9PLEO|nr:mitochondrial 54S ribosomal protein YmL47 [Pyrenophora tritici-repentis Pt-1C-BFP]KAA8619146.1 50S ribosomal protein L16 [Pyrenophora tritici-repentis]EDU48931.1 50S ribosomal protein L16 [Pyrenophora tritici-repentis Pt-1C-BFP]KAF7449617.1 50S ribosomal protein [Pyrenophora tritici-repentis]KAF7570264.1 RplP, Ribosomal protein L16-L10E [Pyrenophora tritici-repentis]KAI0575857.1 50S ribosomal protein L16 [Pyrenophora tritici-repentis]